MIMRTNGSGIPEFGPSFWTGELILGLPLSPSLPLSPRVSVQKRIHRPHAYIGHSPVSRARWPLTHYVPRFPSEEHLTQSRPPSMAILLSGRNAGKTKSHTKSFKELLHRIGQPTRLAPPGYADSTKLRTSFAWGRWTKYVDCFIHGPHLQSLTPQEENALVNYALRMSRNGYPIPVKFLRSLA